MCFPDKSQYIRLLSCVCRHLYGDFTTSLYISKLSTKNIPELKNKALSQIAEALLQRKGEIVRANEEDIRRSISENLSAPLLKRLKFDEKKISMLSTASIGQKECGISRLPKNTGSPGNGSGNRR